MKPHVKSIVVVTLSVLIGAGIAFALVTSLRSREQAAPAPRVRALPDSILRTSEPAEEPPPKATETGSEMPIPPDDGDGCRREPPFIGSGRLAGYTVHVPQSYDPDRRYIPLLLFHDDAQKASGFMKVSGFVEIADRLGFVIIAPEDPGVMAWSKNEDATVARDALDEVARQLCLDKTRVYAVGYGAGGRVVEALPCLMPIAGIATAAYRSTSTDEVCTPETPARYIHLAPMHDGYSPVEGGRGCSGMHEPIPLKAKERLWRKNNRCKGARSVYLEHEGTTCYTWSCADTPFASCHVDGGRGWPGTKRRIFDLKRCDGKPAKFPFAETIWRFFADEFGE